MKIYLAGPMRGYPRFNFPAFNAAAKKLRAEGHCVFSPVERDIKRYGSKFATRNPTGDEELATKEHGFNLRETLDADMHFICRYADAVALLPGWKKSKGARAEKAVAEALNLKIIYAIH